MKIRHPRKVGTVRLTPRERHGFTVIGDEDYTESNIGYRVYKDGLTAWLAPVVVTPVITVSAASYAKRLPGLNRAAIFCDSGKTYVYNGNTAALGDPVGTFSKYPVITMNMYSGKDPYTYFFVGTRICILSNTRFMVHTTVLPKPMVQGVYHCGRIFAVASNDLHTLYWSPHDIFALWNSSNDENGSIKLPLAQGNITGLETLGNSIVVIRRYGITVVKTLGDIRHMSVERSDELDLPFSYTNGSVKCDGKIYIATDGGLCVFDGSKVTNLGVRFSTPSVDFETAFAFDHKLYFSRRVSGYLECFEYDPATGCLVKFANKMRSLFSIDGGLMGVNQSNVLCTFSSSVAYSTRSWQSKTLDFGTTAQKTLKTVTVEGSGNVSVTVLVGGEEKKTVPLGTTYVGEVASAFAFKVKGCGKVTKLTCEWEVS